MQKIFAPQSIQKAFYRFTSQDLNSRFFLPAPLRQNTGFVLITRYITQRTTGGFYCHSAELAFYNDFEK